MHRNIEQIPLQQSTEWHHSIIDWISHEAFVVVRPRAYTLEDLRSHELFTINGRVVATQRLGEQSLGKSTAQLSADDTCDRYPGLEE